MWGVNNWRLGVADAYHQRRNNKIGASDGKMHGTSSRPQFRSRAGGLPRMHFRLWRLPQQLRLRLVLLWRRDQLRRQWQVERGRQFKAALVARRFASVVHACPGGVTHAGPRGC